MNCTKEECFNPVKARGFCHNHYEQFRRTQAFQRVWSRQAGQCLFENCTNTDLKAKGLCHRHYIIYWKYGRTHHVLQPKGSESNSHGYRVVTRKDHILSPPSGRVGVHRIVLFDRIGFGPHKCHWCSEALSWGSSLVVDHLDFNRANNDPNNLVPSCNACNVRRTPSSLATQ